MANTGSVSAQMTELLDEVNKDIEKSAKTNIQTVAKESVQKLKNTSPVKTGSYAKGRTDNHIRRIRQRGHHLYR